MCRLLHLKIISLKKPLQIGLCNKAVRDRKIQRHPITLGLRGLVMSEVVAGLKEGDHVLTDAESVLKDGTRVRIEKTKRVFQSQTDQKNSKNELPVKFD